MFVIIVAIFGLGKQGTSDADPDRDEMPCFILFTPLFAVAVVVIYAATAKLDHGSTLSTVLAVGLATVGAATLSGLLLGFLFGLPRVAVAARTAGTGADESSGLETNSNLDEVSDWLTKILVGLGLVQLGRISHAVSHLGQELAPGLGSMPGAKTFAIALILYSAIDGFLIGYIWTRVDLSRIFKKAHESLRTRIARKTVHAIDTTLQKSTEHLAARDEAIRAAQELLAIHGGSEGGEHGQS
jgi:hypothetical protein